MKIQREFQLQKMVAQYLRTAYKGVHFLSDVRAALKLTIPQQVRSKTVQADDFACPDMVIFEARNGKHGLFLELKAETPYKKNGELKSSEHLERQAATIESLRAKGYAAGFCWDFDRARTIIDRYLKGEFKV